MRYQNITEGIFLSRPNRFIAKVLILGKEETVHVKNTGRCRELLLPGAKVYLARAENPARKTAWDLVGIWKEGLGLVNIDSQAPNQAVGEWLAAHTDCVPSSSMPKVCFAPFLGLKDLKPEYPFGKSRIDFFFRLSGRAEESLLEVKGVTLEREGVAYFPDAPTERGVKHIRELESAIRPGRSCYLAFVVQMPGILEVRPNDETHPAFGEALRHAAHAGLHVLALSCRMEPDSIEIDACREITSRF